MNLRELGIIFGRIVVALITSILLVWTISFLGSALIPSAKSFFMSIFSTTAIIISAILIYVGLEENELFAKNYLAEKETERKRLEDQRRARLGEKEEIIQERAEELKSEMIQTIIDVLKADPGRHFSDRDIRHFFTLGNDEASRRALNLAMGYFWQHPNSAEGIKRHVEYQGGLREPVYYYYYEAK